VELEPGAVEELVSVFDRAFWHGKCVFLTGHTGFKGGWLTTWLRDMGARVSGYALPPDTDPSYFALCELEAGMTSVIGDVRDAGTLADTVRASQAEVVFHFAAQPLVRRSYNQPAETFSTNVLGTVNLLEAVRLSRSVKAVVVVTSDKCYENGNLPWGYREIDQLGGHDPYSASKACAEIICAAYRRSFFEGTDSHASLATVRAGNVIGGGDWSEDRIVPDAIKAFTRSLPLVVRNPTSVRPWQHVLEPLAGYLRLAQRLYCDGPSYTGAWNFGANEEHAIPVSTLASTMVKHWGGNAGWRPGASTPALHEANYLRLDSGKSRSLLGWRSQMPFEDAVEMTVRWYRAATAQKMDNMDAISREQIHDYEQRMGRTVNEIH
jgi:CDP-glucose 4,6-dehydratase